MEKLFSYLIGLINPGQEKNVSKKKKKGKKKICPFCTNSDVFKFDEWEQDTEYLISLLTDRRVQLQDSPCNDCIRLLYKQHWFIIRQQAKFIGFFTGLSETLQVLLYVPKGVVSKISGSQHRCNISAARKRDFSVKSPKISHFHQKNALILFLMDRKG